MIWDVEGDLDLEAKTKVCTIGDMHILKLDLPYCRVETLPCTVPLRMGKQAVLKLYLSLVLTWMPSMLEGKRH